MTSTKISKETLVGIKILQDCSVGNPTINNLITQIVDKKLTELNLAIRTTEGYITIGDVVTDSMNHEFTVMQISDDLVYLESKESVVDDTVKYKRTDSYLYWLKKVSK